MDFVCVLVYFDIVIRNEYFLYLCDCCFVVFFWNFN